MPRWRLTPLIPATPTFTSDTWWPYLHYISHPTYNRLNEHTHTATEKCHSAPVPRKKAVQENWGKFYLFWSPYWVTLRGKGEFGESTSVSPSSLLHIFHVGNAARRASFFCFMKDVSLMHGYENGKHEGYGNERKFLRCVFFCLRDNTESFLSFCFFGG